MKLRIPRITFWRAVLVFILTMGLYATYIRVTQGLGAATNLSDDFPWGIWIGFDILVGVGLAAGGFVITGTVYLFNMKQFKPISRPTVLTAYLGYLLVVTALLFDLGLPHHVWHPIIHWNHHSVMFEVGWCVMLYTTVLTLEFLPLLFEKFGWTKPLNIMHKLMIVFVLAGVLFSTLHQSSLGTLYVLVPDKLHPLWYTGFLPVLFFISSIAGGLAMVIFESYTSSRAFGKELEFSILEKLGRGLVLILGIYFIIRLQTLAANDAFGYIFDGSTESFYFLAEILIGVVGPIILLMNAKIRSNKAYLFMTAVFVLIGFVMNRLNVSVTGMMASSGTTYFPSWMEIAITLSVVAVGFGIFRLAAKYLPVFGKEVESKDVHPAPLIDAGLSGRKVMGVFGVMLVLIILTMGISLRGANKIEPAQEEESFPAHDVEMTLPAAIILAMDEDSPGQVTFNHDSHVDPDDAQCKNCHATEFSIMPVNVGAVESYDMEAMYDGKQCGSCHDGENAFSLDDGCEFCHQVE